MTRQEILAVAKPILFNADMIRAFLDGRKTETRRVVKPQPKRDGRFWKLGGAGWSDTISHITPVPCHTLYNRMPYKPGDYLYVRETWAAWSPTYGIAPKFYYKADNGTPTGIKWHPSIHMPKEAARIFLRVTAVWVERLQDITEDGLHSEGVESGAFEVGYAFAEGVFHGIWDSTIKPADLPLYGWDANPWVWVIGFERVMPKEVN